MFSPATTASYDLLRSLSLAQARTALFTAYVPIDCTNEQLEQTLEAARRSAQGLLPSSMHLIAVIAHLAESMLGHTRNARPPVRSIACFADVDGSTQDDLWVPLEMHVPLQACLRPTYELAPLVGALDRMQPRYDFTESEAALLRPGQTLATTAVAR